MKKLVYLFVLFFAMAISASAANLVEFKGTVTQWKDGKEVPLPGATVIIGTNISLNTGGMTDVIQNAKGIAAQVNTNEKGAFVAKVPAGRYAVILWKAHYVPASYTAAAPGTFKGSISYDNQVGASGRHTGLTKKN
jgi:hypothetical protein